MLYCAEQKRRGGVTVLRRDRAAFIAGDKCTWILHDGIVFLRCSSCGKVCSVTEQRIEDDGVVLPTVICPHCSREDRIRLEGWIIKEDSE